MISESKASAPFSAVDRMARFIGIVIFALLTLNSAHAAPKEQLYAANDAAASMELEFWRSAERIGTADAYRAHLAAFPNGTFAPLARAALEKANATAPAVQVKPAGPQPETPARASPDLRYFSESPPYTGSISFNVGDRFSGPGALTVGWLGAKKQVLLPPGEWVVLAATDSKSSQNAGFRGERPISMVTLVFGKFMSDRVSTMLQFTSDIRPGEKVIWSDIDQCELQTPTRLHHASGNATPFRKECLAIRSIAKPFSDPNDATLEMKRSLDRMGARMGGLAVASILTFAEQANGYLGITRFDWPSPLLGSEGENADSWLPANVEASAPRRTYVNALLAWASSYRKLAGAGYARKLDLVDLEAGAPARQKGLALLEFSPPR